MQKTMDELAGSSVQASLNAVSASKRDLHQADGNENEYHFTQHTCCVPVAATWIILIARTKRNYCTCVEHKLATTDARKK
jgi:hypothetical protein